MKKFLLLLLITYAIAFCETPLVTLNGVGARSLGMGNNYTALANDYSAVFWNPAGLAFTPVREVHAGMGVSSSTSSTELGNTATDFTKSSLYFASAGIVRSIPTKQGGISFAIGYSSPYSLTDIERFTGDDVYKGSSTLLDFGDRIHYNDYKLYTSGNLRLFTAAAGWQVAKGFGCGLSVSYLRGKSKSLSTILSTINDTILYDDGSEYSLNAEFSGLDIRFGGMFQITPNLSSGIRIEIPQIIRYYSRELFLDSLTTYRGELKSSVSGAAGLAYKFPFSTISVDAQFRSPNPEIDDGDLAHWKAGAGAGIEIPIPKTIAILRAGYNWKQFDLFPYTEYIRDRVITDKKTTIDGKDGVHLITAGATFMISDAILLECAYSNTRFNVQERSTDWVNVLNKEYSYHRGNVTVTIQY
jgi:uncharacterized protein YneR